MQQRFGVARPGSEHERSPDVGRVVQPGDGNTDPEAIVSSGHPDSDAPRLDRTDSHAAPKLDRKHRVHGTRRDRRKFHQHRNGRRRQR